MPFKSYDYRLTLDATAVQAAQSVYAALAMDQTSRLVANETCAMLAQVPTGFPNCRFARSCRSCLKKDGCMVDDTGLCSDAATSDDPTWQHHPNASEVVPQPSEEVPHWVFPAESANYCSDRDAACQACQSDSASPLPMTVAFARATVDVSALPTASTRPRCRSAKLDCFAGTSQQQYLKTLKSPKVWGPRWNTWSCASACSWSSRSCWRAISFTSGENVAIARPTRHGSDSEINTRNNTTSTTNWINRVLEGSVSRDGSQTAVPRGATTWPQNASRASMRTTWRLARRRRSERTPSSRLYDIPNRELLGPAEWGVRSGSKPLGFACLIMHTHPRRAVVDEPLLSCFLSCGSVRSKRSLSRVCRVLLR